MGFGVSRALGLGCKASNLGFTVFLLSAVCLTLLPRNRARTPNIGALIIRIGFGVYYTTIIIRNPKTLFSLLRPLHYANYRSDSGNA